MVVFVKKFGLLEARSRRIDLGSFGLQVCDRVENRMEDQVENPVKNRRERGESGEICR